MSEILQQVVYPIAAIVGSGGLIGTWRVGVKGYRSLSRMHERLQLLEHEITPNSGTSMKDAVARIESTTEATQAEVATYAQKLDTHLLEAARVQGIVEGKLELLVSR